MKKPAKQKLQISREVVKTLETAELRAVDGAGMKTNAGTCGGSRVALMCPSEPEWVCNIVTRIG